MASAISVPYEIDQRGNKSAFTESYAPGQPIANVTFTCDSVDHYQLIRDLIGYSTAAGLTIIRTYPFAYPPSPNLIATAIEDVEFYGKPVPIPGVGLPWLWRNKCAVKCRFELPLWFQNGAGDPSGLPYTSTSFQESVDVLTLPETTYTFPSGWPTTTPVGIRVGKIAITMERHMMPYAPIAQVFPILGCVNDAPITIGGYSCPTGTLLFLGFSAAPEADSLGNIVWNTQYGFEYRERPWNQFLSPDPTEGWAIPLDGSGNPVFSEADFTTIP